MGSIYASVAQLIRLLRLKPDDLNGLRFDEYLAQIEREGRQKFPDIDLAIQSSLAILDRVIAILEKGV